MIRIALLSLFHDPGKLVAAIAGVAFAGMLLVVECGVYAGFVRASSALIERVGGDLWVMGRGTRVVDASPVLPGSSRRVAREHPCVVGVRAVAFRYVKVRLGGKAELSAVLAGYEGDGRHLLPWQMVRGLPQDLHGPLRVTVDASDLERLGVEGDPIGARLRLGDRWVKIAGLTSGVRSFSLSPYLFTELSNLRLLAQLGSDEANFWVLDLADARCADDVRRWVERHPQLEARTTQSFRAASEAYWVWNSGAGPLLGFSALLGLLVGSLIVAQTLYTLTKDHARELAMLKAIGASRGELMGFVGWQALFLLATGGGLGLGLAFVAQRIASGAGLSVVLSPTVVLLGVTLIAAMCVAASAASLRLVRRLAPTEVLL